MRVFWDTELCCWVNSPVASKGSPLTFSLQQFNLFQLLNTADEGTTVLLTVGNYDYLPDKAKLILHRLQHSATPL